MLPGMARLGGGRGQASVELQVFLARNLASNGFEIAADGYRDLEIFEEMHCHIRLRLTWD